MTLSAKTTRETVPTSPLFFDATFYKPDHFTSGDNFWQEGIRWQTWNFNGLCLGLKLENSGKIAEPKINITIYSAEKLLPKRADILVKEIRYRYNLDLDLNDFYHHFDKDTILNPAIKNLYGMRPGHPSSLYEYLIIGVVLQNATVRRSIAMFRSLLENYGTELEFDGKKLWCFWQPGRLKDITVEELRTLKIGYRAKFIKKIDDQFAQGLISETDLRSKDTETQRAELLKLYGVGPATAWFLLFDVFHHWDFFDHISPWEQKIYSKIFFGLDPEKPISVKKLLSCINKFRPYQQLAVHYLWEDLWWRRKNGEIINWLEKEIRV